jgi:hypothetical protein
MATVPLPSRRPNEAERVDGEEDYADYNQSNLEKFFARDVVHENLLSASLPGPVGVYGLVGEGRSQLDLFVSEWSYYRTL